MARPIKETPILRGEDARKFTEKMVNLKSITKEERKRAEKIYEEFKSIAKFSI